MIAADTSTLSAFFKGDSGKDVELVHMALDGRNICLSPVVVIEMLSDPLARQAMMDTVAEFPQLSITDGYWLRAGTMRRLRSGAQLRR